MPTPPVPYYTTSTDPGDANEQLLPGESLGGYTSTTEWTGGVLGDLFSKASSIDVSSARSDYRGLFLANDSETDTLTNITIEVVAVTSGASGTRVGLDPRPATYTDSISPQLVEIASGYTAPSGVTFASLIVIGDLPPGTGKGFWIKRLPSGANGSAADEATITISADGGVTDVRSILWEVEPYSQYTNPVRPQVYTASPTPFRRVTADFLSQGGSRFTWQLDRTFRDTGPYIFQLQGSRVGTSTAPDWTDIGPASQDPTYLLDTSARLWGQAKPWFYRAVLTTADGSYTSQTANVFGQLNVKQWLDVREILRKEELVLRNLAGLRGTLLKARRYGTWCSCKDEVTGEVGNSGDTTCYGTGYVGGYYPPVALTFAIPSERTKKERVAYGEGLNTVLPDTLRVRMLATTPINTRDVWVHEGGDDRFHVQKIDEVASWQGVPIVYEVTMSLAPRSDVIYTFPIPRPEQPVDYWRQPTTVDL